MSLVPDDLIKRLACDSYRARQLLRLTCRRYYDALSQYCKHENIGCSEGEKDRSAAIKFIFDHVNNFTSNALVTEEVTIKEQCLYFTGISLTYLCKGIRLLISRGNGEHVCALQDYYTIPWSFIHGPYTHICVIFCGKRYHLLLFVVGVLDYIRDHLPELYREIQIVV